jgi:hypothetical protein
MTVASSTAGSGAILGVAVVLVFQQLGFLALSELWPGLVWLLAGALAGGIGFGLVGRSVDRA